MFTALNPTSEVGTEDELRLLRPIVHGRMVVCLLGAWRDRSNRNGPSFFVKPSSSLIDPGSAIVYPKVATKSGLRARDCRGHRS